MVCLKSFTYNKAKHINENDFITVDRKIFLRCFNINLADDPQIAIVRSRERLL
jgi:hypothetical protein